MSYCPILDRKWHLFHLCWPNSLHNVILSMYIKNTKLTRHIDPFLIFRMCPEQVGRTLKGAIFSVSQQNRLKSIYTPNEISLPVLFKSSMSLLADWISFCNPLTTWTTGPDQSGPLFSTCVKWIDIGIIWSTFFGQRESYWAEVASFVVLEIWAITL